MINSSIIKVMTNAVRKAGKGLIRDYGELTRLQVSAKGNHEFVTSADLKAEKILIEELQRVRPEYAILSEEAGAIIGQKAQPTHRWVIDPLDGTNNFMHGLPHFCISVAVEEISETGKEVIAGVIFAPILNEIYVTQKGEGAFCNDSRLQVSGRGSLQGAMLCGSIRRYETIRRTHCLNRFNEDGANLRVLGSGALDLAYVAAGRVDAFWHEKLNPWDMAAGVLMVREAGGKVTAVDGTVFDVSGNTILAANSDMHQKVQKILTTDADA